MAIKLKDALTDAETNIVPGAKFNIENLETVVMGAVAVLLIVATMVIFICVIWSAFQWLTSGGDKATLQTARSRLTNCLVGLAIMALAWAVISLVQYFFGLDGLFTDA